MLFVYNDYPTINAMADALDAKIAVDSIKAGGQDYLTLTSLSLRQVFGALQFTGTPDRPLIFIKEISSNSDIQTVDVIFPAHPALLYLNPALLRYLLDPLFENQESGRYPKTSAIHDLGTFPVARGYPHGNDEEMPLEECGNMIIMALAYAQRTGDLGYLAAHYAILRTWAGYLIEEALVPQYQLSTDDFAGKLANQTNLALKGIIALEAMAQISKLLATSPSSSPSSLIAAAVAASRARGSSLSYADDALQYSSVAASYMTQWQTIGAINHRGSGRQRLPHATLSYDDPDSHGLLYNLFADRLLDTKLVPHEVYDMQARWYPTVALRHGVPLDTRHRYTKADWMMFCAAATMPPPELSGDGRTAEDDAVALATRDMFISKMAAWVSETRTHRAMTDLYDAETGDYPGLEFVARPVMGAMFALLSLEPYTEIKLGRGQLVSQ